jgi:hypothetical protein
MAILLGPGTRRTNDLCEHLNIALAKLSSAYIRQILIATRTPRDRIWRTCTDCPAASASVKIDSVLAAGTFRLLSNR